MTDLYINVGNEKTCLFVSLSRRLLNELTQYPFLHDAAEEALVSAKAGYFSAGILVWYQLLMVLGGNQKSDAMARNTVAHDILKNRPRKMYDDLLSRLKTQTTQLYESELSKSEDQDAYRTQLTKEWKKQFLPP